MTLHESIEKFNLFLDNMIAKTGAKELCEAVRTAAKSCFEADMVGLGVPGAGGESTQVTTGIPGASGESYSQWHRRRFHDEPLAKFKARLAAKNKAATPVADADPAATERPQDESVGG